MSSKRNAIAVPEKLDIYNVKQEVCDLECLIETNVIRKDTGSDPNDFNKDVSNSNGGRIESDSERTEKGVGSDPAVSSRDSDQNQRNRVKASQSPRKGNLAGSSRSRGISPRRDGSPRKQISTRQATLDEDSEGSDIRIDKDKIVIKINLKNLKKKRKKSKRKKYKTKHVSQEVVTKSQKIFSSKVSVNIEDNVNYSISTEQNDQRSATSNCTQSVANDLDAIGLTSETTSSTNEPTHSRMSDGLVRINSGVDTHNKYTLRKPSRVSEVSSQLSQKILELTHERLHRNYNNSLLSVNTGVNKQMSCTSTSRMGSAVEPTVQSESISAKTRFAKLQNYRSIRELLQQSSVDYRMNASRLKYMDKCNNNFHVNLNQSRSYEDVVDLTEEAEPVADEFIDINELQAFIPYESYLKQMGDGSQGRQAKATATVSSRQMTKSVPNLIRIDKNVCEIRDITPSNLNPAVSESLLKNIVHEKNDALSGKPNKILNSPLRRSQTKQNASNLVEKKIYSSLEVDSSPIDIAASKKCPRSVANNSETCSGDTTLTTGVKVARPSSKEIEKISAQLESIVSIPKAVPPKREKSHTHRSEEIIIKENVELEEASKYSTPPKDLAILDNNQEVSSKKTEQSHTIPPKRQNEPQKKQSPTKVSLRSFRKEDGQKNQVENPKNIPTKVVNDTIRGKPTRDYSIEEILPQPTRDNSIEEILPLDSTNSHETEKKSEILQDSRTNKETPTITSSVPTVDCHSSKESVESIDRISPIMLSEIIKKMQLEAASRHEQPSPLKDLVQKDDPSIHGKSSNDLSNKSNTSQIHLHQTAKLPIKADIDCILGTDCPSSCLKIFPKDSTEAVSMGNVSSQTCSEKLNHCEDNSEKSSDLSTAFADNLKTPEKGDNGHTDTTLESSPQETLFEALDLFKDQNHLPRAKMRKQNEINNLLEELEKLDNNEDDTGVNNETGVPKSLENEIDNSNSTVDQTNKSFKNVLNDLKKPTSTIPNDSQINDSIVQALALSLNGEDNLKKAIDNIDVPCKKLEINKYAVTQPRKSNRIRKLRGTSVESPDEVASVELEACKKVDGNDGTAKEEDTIMVQIKNNKVSPEKVKDDITKHYPIDNVNNNVMNENSSIESINNEVPEPNHEDDPKTSIESDIVNIEEENNIVETFKSSQNKIIDAPSKENAKGEERTIPVDNEVSMEFKFKAERRSQRVRKSVVQIFKKKAKKLVRKSKNSEVCESGDHLKDNSRKGDSVEIRSKIDRDLENNNGSNSSTNNESVNVVESKKFRSVEEIEKAHDLNAIAQKVTMDEKESCKKVMMKKRKTKKIKKISKPSLKLKGSKKKTLGNNSVETVAEIHENPATQRDLTRKITRISVPIRRSKRKDSIKNTIDINEISVAPEEPTTVATTQVLADQSPPKTAPIRRSKRKETLKITDVFNEINVALAEPTTNIPKTNSTKEKSAKANIKKAKIPIAPPVIETLKRSSRLSSVASTCLNKTELSDPSTVLEKIELTTNVSKSKNIKENPTKIEASTTTIPNVLPVIKTLKRASRRSSVASTSSNKSELSDLSPMYKVVAINKENLEQRSQQNVDANFSVVDKLIAYNKDILLRQSVRQSVDSNVEADKEKCMERERSPVAITSKKCGNVNTEKTLVKQQYVSKAKKGRSKNINNGKIVENVRKGKRKILKGKIVKRKETRKKSLRLRPLRKRGILVEKKNKLEDKKSKMVADRKCTKSADERNNNESSLDSITLETKTNTVEKTLKVERRGRKKKVKTETLKEREPASKLKKRDLTKNLDSKLSKLFAKKSKPMSQSRPRKNEDVVTCISHINSPSMRRRIRQAAQLVEQPSMKTQVKKNVKRKEKEKKSAKDSEKTQKLTKSKTKAIKTLVKTENPDSEKTQKLTKSKTEAIKTLVKTENPNKKYKKASKGEPKFKLKQKATKIPAQASDLSVSTIEPKKVEVNNVRNQTIVDIHKAITEQILKKKRDKINAQSRPKENKTNEESTNVQDNGGKKKRGRKPKASKHLKLTNEGDLNASTQQDVYDFQDDLETEMPTPRKLCKVEAEKNFPNSCDENAEYNMTTDRNLVEEKQTESNFEVPNTKEQTESQTTNQTTQRIEPKKVIVNARKENQKPKIKKIQDKHLYNIIQNIKTELKEKLSKSEPKSVQSSGGNRVLTTPNSAKIDTHPTPIDLSKTSATHPPNPKVIEIIVDSDQNTINFSQFTSLNAESTGEDFNAALLSSIKIKKEQLRYYESHKTQMNQPLKSFAEPKQLKDVKDIKPASQPKLLKDIKPVSVLLSCQLCDKLYKSQFRLKQHLRKNHVGEIFECDCCAEYFIDQVAYDEHMQSHDDGIICRLCGDKFPKASIRDHLISHIKEDQRKSLTEECFNKKQTSLLTHFLKKHNFKLQCHLCTDTFCPRSNVLRHYLTKHSNDKIFYSCHRCDKRFSLLQNLKRHLAIHEGITYTCGVCDRTYSRLSDYKIHVKMHVGLKFECPICFKCTSRPSYLKKHMIMLHGRAYSDQELNLKTSL